MIEKWKKYLGKSRKCKTLLTDLQKAFNCLLYNDLLLAELNAYGFDKKILKLLS